LWRARSFNQGGNIGLSYKNLWRARSFNQGGNIEHN